MSELILDYIEHLEVEGGRSAHTAENYKLYLERFVEFTNDIEVEKNYTGNRKEISPLVKSL